ncbi:MarR family winged helix-turn-helix transcriptional regulator [Nonomuraea roseoviolacea]|uniref:DNA-binding MarR family transcriptional regulator n=1 Tax=Nonomuraea roseoviolacea subsp. carminata TaxID=160689 RepID=A0ABT1JX73_9ACTN|nr:MarR family transcriptional regulator [Nonomuraea roseoviolacea]MCP2345969.1 DNA-binding MarR family transcriptional regulator [Nonomuraea roseoviolacea subsp. carminata]
MDPDFLPRRRLLTAIKNAEHATQQVKDAAVRAAGLTMAQYNVMILLTETPGITSAELARRCFVSPQSMNETVAKLEKAGLIERTPHPLHRHVRETVVTPAGRILLDEADDRVLELERLLRDHIPREQQEVLRDLLATIEALAHGRE